jgi:hypothetical protein
VIRTQAAKYADQFSSIAGRKLVKHLRARLP